MRRGLSHKKNESVFYGLSPEAQLVGGRPGARSPLAPERGAPPPLQNEKKERMAKISITGIRKK